MTKLSFGWLFNRMTKEICGSIWFLPISQFSTCLLLIEYETNFDRNHTQFPNEYSLSVVNDTNQTILLVKLIWNRPVFCTCDKQIFSIALILCIVKRKSKKIQHECFIYFCHKWTYDIDGIHNNSTLKSYCCITFTRFTRFRFFCSVYTHSYEIKVSYDMMCTSIISLNWHNIQYFISALMIYWRLKMQL